MVRAKFTCIGVTKRKGWGGHEFVYDAEFSAVTKHDLGSHPGAAEENASFFAATPSGTIKLSTLSADHFVVGQDYYVDFTPA